jgi:hypothetical protein
VQQTAEATDLGPSGVAFSHGAALTERFSGNLPGAMPLTWLFLANDECFRAASALSRDRLRTILGINLISSNLNGRRSAAALLVFAMPGASWSRIIGLDPSGDRALVWYRDESR